jgi:hypothetical protein
MYSKVRSVAVTTVRPQRRGKKNEGNPLHTPGNKRKWQLGEKNVIIANFDLCMVGRRVIDFQVDKKIFRRECLPVIRDKINFLCGSNL